MNMNDAMFWFAVKQIAILFVAQCAWGVLCALLAYATNSLAFGCTVGVIGSMTLTWAFFKDLAKAGQDLEEYRKFERDDYEI